MKIRQVKTVETRIKEIEISAETDLLQPRLQSPGERARLQPCCKALGEKRGFSPGAETGKPSGPLWSIAVVALLAVLSTGCGSSKYSGVVPDPTLTTGLPTPSAAGSANTYNGGQSPGQWTVTIDNSKNTFSYQPITYPAAPTAGTLETSGGFKLLSNGGLAYEIPGRVAVVRPGDITNPPLFTVPQTQCYPITGKVRFQYIGMFPGSVLSGLSSAAVDPLQYGSFVASSGTSGAGWNIEAIAGSNGLLNSLSASSPLGSVLLAPSLGAVSFGATCTAENGSASLPIPNTNVLSTYWAYSVSGTSLGPAFVSSSGGSYQIAGVSIPSPGSNAWVGPSGFLSADQSVASLSPATGSSLAGMLEPSAALSTSAVAASQYLGFLFEGEQSYSTFPTNVTTVTTAPVAFGQVVTGSGTTLTGGIYPNDNVSGTPNADTELTLGSQDTQINGLYPTATITVLDPEQNCANFSGSTSGFPLLGSGNLGVSTGIDAQGYFTCTFPAVAIVGYQEGKYAIFVNSYNWAIYSGGAPMHLYLFQQ